MNAPQFKSILDRDSSTIEKPKPMPVGHYTFVVQGLPRYDKSKQKQTEFAEFTVTPIAADEDVDANALAAMGGFEGKKMRLTFYLTEDAAWRLVKFLDDCGVEDGILRQRAESANGAQFKGEVAHSASQDGESVFANIVKTFPV